MKVHRIVRSTQALGLCAAALFACLVASIPRAACADTIILRDATRLQGVTVESLDEDGVRFSNGEQLGWESIASGSVDESLQGEFDRLVDHLGMPLFRIQSRLQRGDNHQLVALSEPLFATYRDRQSESSILVCIGLMRGRMAEGDRAGALVPYFVALRSLDSFDPDDAVRLTLKLGLACDLETGMCSDLLPIWFDSQSIERALPQVLALMETNEESLPPACGIYTASLAASASDFDSAESYVDRVRPITQELLELIDITRSHIATMREPGASMVDFESKVDKLLPRNRAIALYWLGVAGLQANDQRRQQDAMLNLLRIPAEYGQYSELAAAGLYQTYVGLGRMNDEQGQRSIVRELLDRYPNSVFAERVSGADALPGDN